MACINTVLAFALLVSSAAVALGQDSPRKLGTESRDGPRQLYRISVEDGVEAALIEQELKIKSEMVRDGQLYYFGTAETNRRLAEFGYLPLWVDADDTLTQVVRVVRKGRENDLRETGVTVVLRERGHWVVRVTTRQLRLLRRLGYAVQSLRTREPVPRLIRLVLDDEAQLELLGRVDVIDSKRRDRATEVLGAAFDDAIDLLKAQGLEVEILPDPPGVVR